MGYKKETEMKITKQQLKQIIKEEISKIISANDLYLAEMFDTGGAGDAVGGMPAENMKDLCEKTHGKGAWVEGTAGENGYCKKPVQEELESNEPH